MIIKIIQQIKNLFFIIKKTLSYGDITQKLLRRVDQEC